jgi:hypothetical protein
LNTPVEEPDEISRPSAKIREIANALERLEEKAIDEGATNGIRAIHAVGIGLLISMQEVGLELNQAVEEVRSRQSVAVDES